MANRESIDWKQFVENHKTIGAERFAVGNRGTEPVSVLLPPGEWEIIERQPDYHIEGDVRLLGIMVVE